MTPRSFGRALKVAAVCQGFALLILFGESEHFIITFLMLQGSTLMAGWMLAAKGTSLPESLAAAMVIPVFLDTFRVYSALDMPSPFGVAIWLMGRAGLQGVVPAPAADLVIAACLASGGWLLCRSALRGERRR